MSDRSRTLAVFAACAVAAASAPSASAAPADSAQAEAAAAGRPCDADCARIERLAAALRIPTVSPQRPEDFDPAPFLAFHRYLEATYPQAHRVLEREVVADYSLLYTWRGSDPALAPVLLTAHIDVVPIVESSRERWEHPPFAGDVADGFVWGRGALDDKGSLISIFEAVEALASSGFVPRRGVLLAFGHDEELGGEAGAAAITALLAKRGVRAWFSLDEGMAILQGIGGIERPVAVVGIAEKGFLTIEVTARAPGGHSSLPPRETAIGRLARAIVALEDNPMPAHLDGVAGDMLRALAPSLSGVRAFALRNLWLTGPLVERDLAASPPTNALLRTTTAVTMVRGGVKSNVLPSSATATVNFRVHPADRVDGIVERVGELLADLDVDVRIVDAREASDVADTGSDSFALLRDTVATVYPGVPTVPGLVLGGTDTRHYGEVAENGYRFAPFRMPAEDAARIHGIGERIAVDAYLAMPPFYEQLLRKSTGAP